MRKLSCKFIGTVPYRLYLDTFYKHYTLHQELGNSCILIRKVKKGKGRRRRKEKEGEERRRKKKEGEGNRRKDKK